MALQSGLQLELPNNFGFKHLPKLIEDERVDVALIMGQLDQFWL